MDSLGSGGCCYICTYRQNWKLKLGSAQLKEHEGSLCADRFQEWLHLKPHCIRGTSVESREWLGYHSLSINRSHWRASWMSQWGGSQCTLTRTTRTCGWSLPWLETSGLCSEQPDAVYDLQSSCFVSCPLSPSPPQALHSSSALHTEGAFPWF